MNTVILSRWLAGSASPKEHQSAIANDGIRCLNNVFGPLPEEQPGDQSPVADKLAADQVRLASRMAVVLRI
jgi:hypothetical protein